MFQISKRLTNSAHNRLQEAVIINSEMLSDDFKLVSFKCDITGLPLLPAQELLVYTGERYITGHILSSVGKMQQLCCALFHLNDQQYDNDYIPAFKPGEAFQFSVEKQRLAYNAQATHHFFFGDETSIGLFNVYKETALKNNHEYFGVFELNPNNDHVLNRLKLLVDCVPRAKEQPAQNAIKWMDEMHPHCWAAWQNASFYLAGRPELTGPFCEYLQQRNVSLRQIQMA
jgi:hypothetical protein